MTDSINVDYISGKYSNIDFEPAYFLVYTYQDNNAEKSCQIKLDNYYLTETSNDSERDSTIFSACCYRNWEYYLQLFYELEENPILNFDKVQLKKYIKIKYNDIENQPQV